MKIYSIPDTITTIIFDIDGTLYTNSDYVKEQVDVQLRHWAKINGMSADEARKKMANFRENWALSHGGEKISLGNAFIAFGVDLETSIKWRNELLVPENYLKVDKKLFDALSALKKTKCVSYVCVTNNPVQAAKRTLKALGVEKLLPQVVGLDSCKKSKPAKEMLELALKITGAKAENCLSVGDRYDIDLALPLQLGMGAVLVTGVEDVYNLCNRLSENLSF